MQSVTAIDDGGMSLSSAREFTVSRVLCLEVCFAPDQTYVQAKRMKSKERTNLETIYAHAAQIFCEMLGQVCHKEFYDNPHTNFQEVIFVLIPLILMNRHLSSMRDMLRVISSTPVFQTTI